jgi:hypothetical protein
MLKQPRIDRWVRLVAVVIGMAAAAVAVLSWRIPAGSGKPGLDLTVTATPLGPVGLSPSGPLLHAGTMAPSAANGAALGTLGLANRSGAPLSVRLRGLPSSRHIDAALWVEVLAGRQRVVKAPLASLRTWSAHGFVLPAGARRSLEVRAWLPRSAHPGWVGRIETVELQVRGQLMPETRRRR